MANTKEFNITGNSVEVLNANAKAADNAGKSYTSAKAELRALQNQMLEMDQSSEEFKKASARAAQLKDDISDLSAEISANAGNAFEGLSNNVSLFGSRLMDLDLKGAGQALTGMGSAVSRIDFKTLKTEVGGLIKGLADLGKAILANPILLFAGIIAGVIANWKEFSALFKGETQVLNSLKQELGALEAQNAAIKNKITYSKIYGDSLYTQYKLSQDLLANEIKQEQTKKRIAEIQDDSEASEAARKRIIELQNQALLEQTQHIVEYYNTISSANLINNDAAKIEDEKRKATEKYTTALEETRAKLIQLRADRKLSLSGVGNAFDIEVYESNEKKLLDAIDKTNKTIDKREADAKRERLKQIQEQADDKELERRKKLNDEMMAEDDHMRRIELSDLIDAEKIKGDKRLQTEMQIHANLTALRAEHSAQELEEAKKLAEEKLKAEQNLYEAKWALATASVDLLGTIFQKNKKAADVAFALDKALAIGKVVVDTQAEIAGYYAANALAGPAGMAIATSQALAAKIRAATSIATIAASSIGRFIGGGSGAASSAGGGGSAPSGTTAPTQTIGGLLPNQPTNQPPIQAYVIGGQVATSIEAQQLIQNQSRLGG